VGHFEDDSDIVNELRMFDKLKEMKEDLSKMKEINFIVEKGTGIFWYVTSLILSSAAGAGAYVLVTTCGVGTCLLGTLRCCLICKQTNSDQPRPGRPAVYPYRKAPDPVEEMPYEMRPMTSSAIHPARETSCRIYVELSKPAITGLPASIGGM